MRTLFYGKYCSEAELGYDVRAPKPGEIWALDADAFRRMLELRHALSGDAATGLKDYVWVGSSHDHTCFQVTIKPGPLVTAFCRQVLLTHGGSPFLDWPPAPVQYGLVFEVPIESLLRGRGPQCLLDLALPADVEPATDDDCDDE